MRYIFLLLLALVSFNLSSQNQLLVGSQLKVGDKINVTDNISMISSSISGKGKPTKSMSVYTVSAQIEVSSISDKEINFLMVIDSLCMENVGRKDTSIFPVYYTKMIPQLNVSILNTNEGRKVLLNNEKDFMKLIYYTAESEVRTKYLERIDMTYFNELFLTLFPFEVGVDLKDKEILKTQKKIVKNKELWGNVSSQIDGFRILIKEHVAFEKTSKFSLMSKKSDGISASEGLLTEVVVLDFSSGVIVSSELTNNYTVSIKSSTAEKSTSIDVGETRTITCSFK